MEKLKELLFFFSEMTNSSIDEKVISSLKDIRKEVNNIITAFENPPKKVSLVKPGDKVFVIKGRGHNEAVYGNVISTKEGFVSILDEKINQEVLIDETKVIVSIYKV
jgi:hypothetical protein